MSGPRVTSQEVKEIINTTETNLDAFIHAANLMVTEKLGSSDLSNNHLKEIERWLAAHFLAMKEDGARVLIERTGESQVEYNDKSGQGLQGTRYGQQAIVLDYTGALASLGRSRARFSVY